MKKYNKLKKIFIVLILTMFASCIGYNVYAKDYSQCTTYINTRYKVTYAYKSNGIVEVRSANGTFEITAIDEGFYDHTSTNVETSFTPSGAASHISTPLNQIIGKTMGDGKPVSFKTRNYKGDDGRVIRLTLVLNDPNDKVCMTKQDYEAIKDPAIKAKSMPYTEYLYIDLIDYESTNVQPVTNNHYNTGACLALRTGNNSSKVIPNDYWAKYNLAYLNDYKKLVPYCFDTTVDYNYTDAQTLSMVKSAIQSTYVLNLNKNVNQGSEEFIAAFERIKERARRLGGQHWNENKKPDQKGYNLKCDYKKLTLTEAEKKEDNYQEGDYQYVNKDYYYASETTVTPVTYTYNYEGGFTQKEEIPNACSRMCEESLIVEYGPPQAAIAGFCIEYQVKVTSRVKCTSKINVQPPKRKTICQPTPYCVTVNGNVLYQGGPNEDFDKCINSCDGGKYTQSCSNKCYKKVYGSNNKAKATEFTTAVTAKQLAASATSNGRYVRNGSNNIGWVNNGSDWTYARWYMDHQRDKTIRDHNSGRYTVDGNGFKRRQYGSGLCGDVCSYIGCDDYTYLDESTVTKDYVQNLEQYNHAVEVCQAAATCTTKTATFKITASYTNADDKEITLEFPLSTKEDVIKTPGPGNSLVNDTTILKYDGCYKDNNENNWYQTEWSFPGTWINNKTGEISFKEINDQTWHKKKDKFCLPLDAKNVNTGWWNWYMAQKNIDASTTGSYKDKEYADKCQNLNNASTLINKAAPEKYNIHAETQNFGYFGWKFNIDCFYALNDGTDLNTSSKKNNDICETTPDAYTTRTVTNTDLFPSNEAGGGKTNTSTNQSATGRTPGFNWTSAAEITSDKNKNYAVNPELLIGKIQNRGKKIYDEANKDEYLDYEFYLTPEDLKAIKQYSKDKKSYSDWDSENRKYNEEWQVYSYSSPLFRSGGLLSASGAAKKLGKLGCNNQANAGSCE